MIYWATVTKATGEIFNIGNCRSESEAMSLATSELDVFTNVPVSLNHNYYRDYSDNSWKPRPVVALPSEVYDLTTLPVGTVVHVSNEAGDEIEISDISSVLTLVDPGDYFFRVLTPFPYFDIQTTVSVI